MTIDPTLVDGLKWGSHQAPLVGCVGACARYANPVLELGVGHFSTPLLHSLCGAIGLPLISVESDKKWCDEFEPEYSSLEHWFWTGDYEPIVTDLIHTHHRFSVAFLDQSDGRPAMFAKLLPCCRYIVVHDYEREVREGIEPQLPQWHKVYDKYLPPTLVASSEGPLLYL
jgi:hypothetical protein